MKKSPLLVVLIITVLTSLIIIAGLVRVLNLTESAYSDLLSEFNEISGRYDLLLGSYDRLAKNYDELADRYSWFDQPLRSKRVLTTSELELWLQTDNTDEYPYIEEDFTCFHFCVILMLHGRAQHFDLGVVAIFGQNNVTGEPFSHCLNAVVATEGLVYIEPQLDEVWWLQNHSEIKNGTIHRFPMFEDPIYITKTSILFDYQ